MKDSRCFIVTPIGFEAEADRELREIWPELLDPSGRPHATALPDGEWTKGGIEYVMDPFLAVQLNFFMKVPHRILLRLEQFKVRDFPKLHERLGRVDLNAWLPPGGLRLEVSASKSRLGHEGRIKETALKAWKRTDDPDGPRVFIRIHDDICEISLDSSGEHLHRRGIQKLRGEAPLRENIAAWCLRKMIADVSPAELSQVTLVDPMCGSGTFLAEAAFLWRPLFQRSFSFQNFRKLPKLFQQPQFAKNYRDLAIQPFAALQGFDQSEEMVEIARQNLSLLSGTISVQCKDLILDDVDVRPAGPLWLIANPPYGERLAGPPLDQVVAAIEAKWRPARLALLLPESGWKKALEGHPRPPREVVPVFNGGIECRLVIWD